MKRSQQTAEWVSNRLAHLLSEKTHQQLGIKKLGHRPKILRKDTEQMFYGPAMKKFE